MQNNEKSFLRRFGKRYLVLNVLKGAINKFK